jgi:DNA-binding response OmpR family regulator
VNKIREGATLYPKDLPVIIISALYELSDKVGGIQDGADDYLVKPFEADELLVRVLSLLRRNPPKYVEHIELKREEYFLEKIAVQVELNDNEKRFLYRIMSREGVPISKHDLLRLIYPNAIGNPDGRGLQMMVGRLKKKLEQYGYDGIKIKRGEGYYWDF